MIKKILLLCCLLMVLSMQAYADDLQTRLTSMRTLHAAFTQEVQAKKRHIASSSGVMALSRPGLFRWQTNQPSEQLVVADGKHIWIYDKELEQVSVKKQTQSLGGAAALFLSEDPATLNRDFQVTKLANRLYDVFLLRARSPKANFEKVQLVFEKQGLYHIILYDQLGQRTTIVLSQVKVNQKLSASLFHFTVPKGVDVVQQ